MNTIRWEKQLVAIRGSRGVGKTTLIRQYIKKKYGLSAGEALYCVMDSMYFSNHTLLDLAERFHMMGGKHLFLDEVHRYPTWSREIKEVIDLYPDMKITFTGSSLIQILNADADLSRRVLSYTMEGLSFREYLAMFQGIELPSYTLEQVLGHEVQTPPDFLPLEQFTRYLHQGYYPFARQNSFPLRLEQVVQKTVEVDIPYYANMNVSTAAKLKQLMGIIARSVPFKPNYQKISQMLDINRVQVKDYMLYLEKAGLLAQLRDTTGGIRALGKVEKVYLSNTALAYLLAGKQTDIGNVRETFFFSQLRNDHDILASRKADFEIGSYTFEVGGHGKGQRQIADAKDGYIVKDEITTGMGNIIPLWHFGLLY